MQKAVNRFWDWLFHPSVRKWTHPKEKAVIYRYPSPGNVKIQQVWPTKQPDYKTPYEKTQYNVRYIRATPMQKSYPVQTFTAAPLCSDAILRLKKSGLLKRGEESDVDKVAQAKAQFQQKFGYSADQDVYVNTHNITTVRSKKREDIAAFIENYHQQIKRANKQSLCYSSIRKTIDDPETIPLESVDMFTAPHFQQSRIANEYMIENFIDEETRKKAIDTYASDARFWKAIDDSFPAEQIKKVQQHIGDPEPTAFEIRRGKYEFEYDKDGKIVDIHPQTEK